MVSQGYLISLPKTSNLLLKTSNLIWFNILVKKILPLFLDYWKLVFDPTRTLVVEQPSTVSSANGLCGQVSQSLTCDCLPRPTRGRSRSFHQLTSYSKSTFTSSGQLVVPLTITSATWVPFPVTAPAEVQSILGKASLTTPVSTRPTWVTGGQTSFSGSPPSSSWL